jgi:hypothetical protein
MAFIFDRYLIDLFNQEGSEFEEYMEGKTQEELVVYTMELERTVRDMGKIIKRMIKERRNLHRALNEKTKPGAN